MLRRIKYLLLRILMNDICLRSDCEKCALSHEICIEFNSGDKVDVLKGPACHEDDVLRQARKVWNVKE